MGDSVVGAHNELHSDQGARQDERRGAHVTRLSRFTTLPGWSSRSRIWFALKPFPGRLALAPRSVGRRTVSAWHRCRLTLRADPARSPVDFRRSRIRRTGPV